MVGGLMHIARLGALFPAVVGTQIDMWKKALYVLLHVRCHPGVLLLLNDGQHWNRQIGGEAVCITVDEYVLATLTDNEDFLHR